MTPIDKILCGKPSEFSPGSLMLRQVGGGLSPRFLFETFDEDGEAEKLAIVLGTGRATSFHAQPVAINEGIWFASMNWELRVDPSAAYSFDRQFPQPGDAFISDGTAGIIAASNNGSIYVSLSGETLAGPNSSTRFVGFEKWKIVHWPTGNESDELETVIERTPQA